MLIVDTKQPKVMVVKRALEVSVVEPVISVKVSSLMAVQ